MLTPTTLAAVLFVELADFSDLFSTDERSAMDILASYRQAVDPIVAEHSGDIVDATGSELLVVFSSAVAAVQCALYMHLALSRSGSIAGAASPAGHAQARVGIHLGEIWRESGKVYGNGVNVAARVMQAAPPGALYISEDVYRQVSGKLDLSARVVDGVELKNIERLLELYEVDSGRGFLGVVASWTDRRSAASGTGPAGHTDGSLREPLHEQPHGNEHAGQPHAPTRPHLPPHGAAPSTSMLAKELRESITREVQDALATARVTRSTTGHGITIDIGPDALATSEEGKPARPTVNASRSADAETRREKASERIAAATKSLVMSGGIGVALGYGYLATDNWLFAFGAVLVGLLPCLSSIKKIVAASSEIRLIDRPAS